MSASVSIVVTSYNYGRFLGEAIESALAQRGVPVEVIVVDDGSVDDSPEIIRGYGDRVTAVLKRNGGQASAFNAGFARAAGRAVLFLDSDDVLLDGAAAAAADALSETGVVHVHWPMREIDSAGEPTGRLVPPRPQREGDMLEETLRGGPLADLHSPTSGNAWARHLLEQVMPMPEREYVVASDAYLFTLSPTFGRVRRLDTPLSSYRRHGANQYHGRALRHKLEMDMRVWDARCRALERRAADLGRTVDVAAWYRDDTEYGWMRRCIQALDDIATLIPAGGRYVLIEDSQFGHDDVVPDRAAVPLIECAGVDDGPPADDDHALAALAERRAGGARYLVVLFPAFWWLEVYPRFAAHLRDHHHRLVANERMIAYDLGARR